MQTNVGTRMWCGAVNVHACVTVHAMRAACEATLWSTLSAADCAHVSCTTNMLSAATPVATKSAQPAKAEMVVSPATRTTMKVMSGKERPICATASSATSGLEKYAHL